MVVLEVWALALLCPCPWVALVSSLGFINTNMGSEGLCARGCPYRSRGTVSISALAGDCPP